MILKFENENKSLTLVSWVTDTHPLQISQILSFDSEYTPRRLRAFRQKLKQSRRVSNFFELLLRLYIV